MSKVLELLNKQLKQAEARKVLLPNFAFIDADIQELKEAIAELEPKTSCHGCKYDDSDVDEEERKAHCIPCKPITLRKNYTVSDDVSQAKP